MAAVWPAWAEYVYKNCVKRFHRFAVHVMGIRPSGTCEGIARKGIEAFTAFLRDINMPTNFAELGVAPTDEQIAFMADSCAAAAGGKKGSAKVLYAADIKNILQNAR